MKIQLTGWHAIVALILLVAFVAVRYTMQSGALETQGVEQVQRWLADEATRSALPEMQQAVAAGDAAAAERMAGDLESDRFEILSVTRHGLGEQIVARVAYRHASRPEAGTRVRYLRMSYSLAAGWRVGAETSRLSYYLAIL